MEEVTQSPSPIIIIAYIHINKIWGYPTHAPQARIAHEDVIIIWSPFYWHGLTLIPTWISNDIHYKMCHEITYPFLNFKVQLMKFRNG